MLPVMDFETFSEANIQKTGAWRYAEDPSTEALFLGYDMRDGIGPRLWAPELGPPVLLFDHIGRGGLIEAHNSFFEFCIWLHVCHRKMGWPYLPAEQLRDSAARCAAWSLPRKLEKAGAVMGLPVQKDKTGHNAMLQVCKPRKPTKNKPWTRNTPENSPDLFRKTGGYCVRDVETEVCLGDRIPQLSPIEERVFLLDQRINARGFFVDIPLAQACASIVTQQQATLNQELKAITGGMVATAACVAELATFTGLPDVTVDTVADALADPVGYGLSWPHVRALQIRQKLGLASVKKVFAFLKWAGADHRVHGGMVYAGADRTARWAGSGPQPHNMTPGELNPEQVEEAARDILSGADLTRWGDPFQLVSNLIRGIIRAAPGCELICSDYSAIEARVLAAIAGEEWRLEVFRTHGLIYEATASSLSGVPFEEFTRHLEEKGEHHPLRKKLGKVPELASGYQGWTGAWRKFGAGELMTEEEMKTSILAWREKSPNIVKLWSGLENAAIRAVFNPGSWEEYNGIAYCVQGGVLYCRLPSGRCLSYHDPKLVPNHKGDWGLTYKGVDSYTKRWVRIETYGGKLTENTVQAISRDILAEAMLRLDAAGYPIVLHVHDEIVAEVTQGTGSVEQFEAIMEELPHWAAGWPVVAAGGWRGVRYRKG